jgi:hypothetical protein
LGEDTRPRQNEHDFNRYDPSRQLRFAPEDTPFPYSERGPQSPDQTSDLQHREASVETQQGTLGTPSTNSLSLGDHRIKKDDVGKFIPDLTDPDDLGIINDGKDTIYTDVLQLEDRLASFLENKETHNKNSRQILELFPSLLGGDAVIWWNSELTFGERRQLRKKGMAAVFHSIETASNSIALWPRPSSLLAH